MRRFLLNAFKIVAAGLGLSFFGSNADVRAASNNSVLVLNCSAQGRMSRQQEVECACDAALKAGTIEALEGFLARYGTEDSACSALASTALANFAPPDGSRPNNSLGGTGGVSGEGGYGR